jgi:lysozyme family protein
MSADFERAVSFTLEHEGGAVEHDAGGVTKWGICSRFEPDVDIQNLTREQAAEIYRMRYWAKIRGDDLPWPINFVVFDYAVVPGPTSAVKALQKAVGVKADGIIGAETIGAVRSLRTDSARREIVRRILTRRMEKFMECVLTNPPMQKYFMGWIKRVMDCQELAG